MGTFGKRSEGEGNKLFLEYSATRLVQLPSLPNASAHSGDVCCLVFSKKTGTIQRTEVTVLWNCLRCRCHKIEKLCLFFFCSSLALHSVLLGGTAFLVGGKRYAGFLLILTARCLEAQGY